MADPDLHLILGEMKGELREFKRSVLSELQEVKSGIKALKQFKWRVAGGAGVLVTILTAVAEAIKTIMKG